MSKKHLAIFLVALGLASVSFCATPLDTSLFVKKLTVTFSGVQSGATLTDFPALVKLSTDIGGFSYSDFKVENGGDLRFADSSGNLIPHEIDTWNPSGVSTVWVKVPSLSQNTKVYAYYGSTYELPAVTAKDVWDENYVGVWHLGESALPMKESSETSSNFTSANGGAVQYAAEGIVGGSVDFGTSGRSSILNAPDHDALDGFTACTIEVWTFMDAEARSYKAGGSDVSKGLLSKRSGYQVEGSYHLWDIGTGLSVCIASNGTSQTSITGITDVPSGVWVHQVVTFNAGNVANYKSGAPSGTGTTPVKKINAGAADLHLGNFQVGDARNFPGKIDEVRISNVSRSAAWVKATYDTISSASFATYEVGDAPGSGKINPDDFKASVEVTFSGYTGEELSDFPALVKLSAAIAGFKYSDFALLNGGDLRFADSSGNLIPHEIDTWDESGVSTVWVKVPSLTSSTKIIAYYGCATPPVASTQSVWDSGYVGVWHLGESALPLKESTGVSTDFSRSTNTVVYGAAGVVGRSVDFSTSYATKINALFADDDPDLDGFEDFTFEVWTCQNAFYTDSSKEQWAGILGKREKAKVDESFFVYQNSLKSMGNTFPKCCYNVDGTEGREMLTAKSLPVLGQWMHSAYTRKASTGAFNMFFDGTNNVSSVATQQGPVHASAAPLQLGWVEATYSTFPGKIDEVRISKVTRSAAWIKASHDTVAVDDFATYKVTSFDMDAFARKMEVGFYGYTGAELKDFPVLVKLSTSIPGFKYSDFSLVNGGDLRFADSKGRLIPHEIDTWNENGVSTVWVKVPTLTSGAKIMACYGCDNPPAVNSQDVWDSDYVGVWHLGESSLPMNESTGVSTPFSTKNGTVAYGTAGVVGNSVDFTASGNNYLKAADDEDLDGFTDFTVELWAMQNTFRTDSNFAGMLTKRNGSNAQESLLVYEQSTDPRVPVFCYNPDSLANSRRSFVSKSLPVLGEWTHYAYTLNSATMRCDVYFNGTNNASATTTVASVFAGTAPLNIGGDPSQQSFPGRIDEVRISKIARSAAWLKATHDTVTMDDFATCVVESVEPDDQIPWYTNGVIACSTPDFTREPGDSYVYAFTTNCTVKALTTLHFTAISQSSSTETDYGYYLQDEQLDIVASPGAMLGLTAQPIALSAIPAAAVTPSGTYTEVRDGAYTVYTFTGSGALAVNRPGVVEVEIVGPKGGETITLSRLILNESASIVINDAITGFNRYLVGAGTDSSAPSGSVTVRVWDACALVVSSVEVSKATFQWGVTALDGTADIRLQYGTSKKALTNIVMLATDATAGVGGRVDVTGLDPGTTYYARLYADSGSGYDAIGEDAVAFTTESLLSETTGGKVITVGDPPVPGLNAGFANVYNIDIAVTSNAITWLDKPVLGIIAATNRTSDLSVTTYPPIWANNRTWVFTGYMYFDGEHYYQFGEAIDDAVKVYVDGGSPVLSDGSWNKWGSGRTKPTEGWHAIELRFGNGTGGAGISGDTGTLTDAHKKDKNGQACGFGWGKSTTNTNPSNMQTLEWLCDPGDGSLLRAVKQPLSQVSIMDIKIDENYYSVLVSNSLNEVVSGTLYYGDSADIDVLTNSASMFPNYTIDLQAGESRTIYLAWEPEMLGLDSGTPPHYVLVFPEIGASEVATLTAGTRVAASVKSVGADSAVITTAVGFDLEVTGDTPTATLTAYYGCVDVGSGASAAALWLGLSDADKRSQVFGTVVAGTYDFTLSGLEVGSNYVVCVKSVDDGGNEAWSDPMKISVSGVYMGEGCEVYENDPRQQKITVHRAGDVSGTMTVFLEYSGNGMSSASKMPRSVTFEPGSDSVDVEFTVADNTNKDGNRSIVASLVAGSAYVAISPSSATVTIVDDESAEGDVVTWTGAKDLNWADDANWDKGHAPRSVDTACFATAGVTSGMAVNLSVSAGIRVLRIETPLAFTISGTGALAVNRVDRTDTEGVEEGKVSISVPVVVGNAENNYSRWNVAGSAGIELNGGLSAPDGIMFMKEGNGDLWLNAANTAYPGPWYVYGGNVYAAAANAIRGDITIAGEVAPAGVIALVENGIAPGSSPSVFTNGTFVAQEADDASLASTRINVYDGGLADIGEHFSAHQAYFQGGRIVGEMFSRGQSNPRIVANNSGLTAQFDADYRIAANDSLEITVEDGASAVDLQIGGRVYYAADAKSSQYLTKFGTGTLRTTNDWTGMSLVVDIVGGRVLVDNPSADGLGNQAVRVNAGATLGGTGFIGGTTASYETSSAVTVAGEGNNEGEIAPGTVDADGNHVIGTLTVGSQAKNGSVAFGDYTKFTVNIGPAGTSDLLLVNGPVTIAQGAGTKLNIVCDDLSQADNEPRVVLRATGGLTGTFRGVTTPSAGWRVAYTSTEILVVPPQPGRKLIIR